MLHSLFCPFSPNFCSDEGTQILKVVNDPPPQAVGDIGYEGMPSDVYLCWVGKGSAMLRGDLPYTATRPDCPGLTQPTIPVVHPAARMVGKSSSRVDAGVIVLSWEPAIALRGGGIVSHYEVLHGGVVRRTVDAATLSVAIPSQIGAHTAQDGQVRLQTWRVRAVNSLGNAGGWSLRQTV